MSWMRWPDFGATAKYLPNPDRDRRRRRLGSQGYVGLTERSFVD
jgi:hypothetical protein